MLDIIPRPSGNDDSFVRTYVYMCVSYLLLLQLEKRRREKAAESELLGLFAPVSKKLKLALRIRGVRRYRRSCKLLHRHRSCCGQRRAAQSSGERLGLCSAEYRLGGGRTLQRRWWWWSWRRRKNPPEEFNAWMKPYTKRRKKRHARVPDTCTRAFTCVRDVK